MHRDEHLDKLVYRRNRQILRLMYQRSRKPECVVIPPRILRNEDKIKLLTRRPVKDIYTKAPYYRGARLWDRLQPAQQTKATQEKFLESLSLNDLRPLEPVVV